VEDMSSLDNHYKNIHDQLTQQYLHGELTLAEFNNLHDQNWRNLDQAKILAGEIDAPKPYVEKPSLETQLDELQARIEDLEHA